MCGIAGIVSNKDFNHKILENMIEVMSHRGPDDSGIEIFAHKKNKIGFGQKRLSIIDLSQAGHQPMSSIDNKIWITFNGEIYNYLEIKKDLLLKGYNFKSTTDTEVFIYAYQEFGIKVFEKLNGMFAVAIWDSEKEELILARDRFGQKPLYFYVDENEVCFASELKSILQNPSIKKELDLLSLNKYLCFEYVPTPFSIIKNIHKIPQGHFKRISFKNNKISALESQKYWEINFNKYNNIIANLSQIEIQNELIRLLKESIEQRLMSDVPLGVFLSGGIDSSAIVALLFEMIDSKKIKTFSIGFKEKSFDETNYARKVARIFRTDHHEQILDPQKMVSILPEILEKLDEPFADASIVPTYLLSKFTHEFVTVALGGDGGDELFAGYDPFLAHFWADYYETIPKFLHKYLISPLANMIPVSSKNMSFDFKLKHFLDGVNNQPLIRNQLWLGAFSPDSLSELYSEQNQDIALNSNPFSIIDINKHSESDTLTQIAYSYQKHYLADDILVKIDRASMMNSLEARTPFLDVKFAEFANSIPMKLKLKGTNRKYILKKSLENRLPHEILYRKKKGFGIPLTKWINHELKDDFKHTLSKERIKRDGYFSEKFVQNLLSQHFSGKVDHRKPLWTLYMFQKWMDNWM